MEPVMVHAVLHQPYFDPEDPIEDRIVMTMRPERAVMIGEARRIARWVVVLVAIGLAIGARPTTATVEK